MLTQPEEFKKWLHEHALPRAEACKAAVVGRGDGFAEALLPVLLERSITPLVYWAGEKTSGALPNNQPRSSPSPAPLSPPTPEPQRLTTKPSQDFMDEYDLTYFTDGTGEELIFPDGGLAREDFIAVSKAIGPAWRLHKVPDQYGRTVASFRRPFQ